MTARPLIVRIGALGDMVLMTVAIRLLQHRFGLPVDVLGSGDWTIPLLRDQPGVGRIYLLHSRSSPFPLSPNQWRLLRDLRQRGSGPTWLFDANIEKTHWLLLRAGWSADQLAVLSQLADIRNEHFCDHWQRFASLDPPALGGTLHPIPRVPAYPQLQVSAQLYAALSPWLQRYGVSNRPWLLLQVGNKRTMRRGSWRRPSNTKYWPEERWAEVLRGLRARHREHALLLLGVPQESALNTRILALAQIDDAHDLAPEMTVPRLMALAGAALGMVSVDTGPAHLAAALGGRVLTLFDSAEKMVMYAPRGPHALVRCLTGSVDQKPSLLGISPQQVLQAWDALIALPANDAATPALLRPTSSGVPISGDRVR